MSENQAPIAEWQTALGFPTNVNESKTAFLDWPFRTGPRSNQTSIRMEYHLLLAQDPNLIIETDHEKGSSKEPENQELPAASCPLIANPEASLPNSRNWCNWRPNPYAADIRQPSGKSDGKLSTAFSNYDMDNPMTPEERFTKIENFSKHCGRASSSS